MANSTPHSQAEAHSEHSVKADILYVKKSSSGAIPSHAELYNKDAQFVEVDTVDIRDVRHSKTEFTIAANGFQYARMVAPQDVDYTDDKSVAEKYLPALEQFVAQQLGASSVKTYNHKVRNQAYGGAYSLDYSGPAIIPHVDVTSTFAPILFGGVQPDLKTAAVEGQKRWYMLNTWQPLKTVQRDPLALADKASVRPEDRLSVPQPERGADVSSWFLQKSSGHRWWYMREQTPDDLLLFLQYDSEGGPVVPHTAFSLPGTSADDPPRESIEVRMVVVF